MNANVSVQTCSKFSLRVLGTGLEVDTTLIFDKKVTMTPSINPLRASPQNLILKKKPTNFVLLVTPM